MKKTVCLLLAALLLIAPLAACSNSALPESEAEDIEEAEALTEIEKLRVVYTYYGPYRLSVHESVAICQLNSALNSPLDGYRNTFDNYLLLDLENRSAHIASSYPEIFDKAHGFLTDDYVYGFEYDEEGSVVYRSKYDDTDMRSVRLPQGWGVRSGQIVADGAGNLYVFISANAANIKGDTCLVRLNFEKGVYETLLFSESETGTLKVEGVYKNGIIVSALTGFVDGLPVFPSKLLGLKLFSPANDAQKSWGDLKDLEIDFTLYSDAKFIDPYTGLYYVEGALGARQIDYDNGEVRNIDFGLPEERAINPSYPRAASEDYFIVRADWIQLKDGSYISKYAMILKSDYLDGNLNLIPINYDAVIEELETHYYLTL
ncbi:MAG: hypothetical protein Q4B42_06870 [Oscillospiraceae bacterium]|nr:hypothetical protein [Oscillospiraceae bacterium]